MAHVALAAGDAIREERAHLRPAEARPIADRVVDLAGRRDAVGDEPQCLAPQGLEQTVGDEPVDLSPDVEHLHSHRGVERARPVDGLGRRLFPGDDLDEWEQVDGVERMADDEALGSPHVPLEQRGEEAGGRGADECVGPSVLVDLGEESPLEVDILRGALLDDVGVDHGGRDRVGKLDSSATPRHVRQA